MSYLSDVDIGKLLWRDIVIDPFSPDLLTPIGYDFTVGEFAFSLETGLLQTIDGTYELPPKNTVQILTKESLWVSGRIAGTFHSKVSLVSKGFSHISTTLDHVVVWSFVDNCEKQYRQEVISFSWQAFRDAYFFKGIKPYRISPL